MSPTSFSHDVVLLLLVLLVWLVLLVYHLLDLRVLLVFKKSVFPFSQLLPFPELLLELSPLFHLSCRLNPIVLYPNCCHNSNDPSPPLSPQLLPKSHCPLPQLLP